MKINKYLIFNILISLLLLYLLYQYSSFGADHRLVRQVESLNKYIMQLENRLERLNLINIYKISDPVIFCNDTLDLSDPMMRESLEREFYVLLTNQAQVLLYLKRTQKYFPMIEKYLHETGLPEDLKYLAVHESALIPTIRSKANAVGIWQFMRSTARLYKLKINSYIDERRDPERATESAMLFMKDLYKKFGSWPLVLAAYNAGQGCIQRAVESQNSSCFFDLSLPEETERYYFKVVATKIILSNPENHGFFLEDQDYYQGPDNYRIKLLIHEEGMYLSEVAKICNLTLGQFRDLNPSFIKPYLPYGEYILKIPYENYSAFVKNCQQYNNGQFNYSFAEDNPFLFD
jgi:membrane-bound lytic murein transglycosylase D